MKTNKQEKEALVRFYGVTGSDYILSFFENEKLKCQGRMISKDFLVFLGDSCDVFEALFINFEEYICAIYNAKYKTLNPVKAEMFTKPYACENKMVDLSCLLICQQTILLHVKCADHVVKLWKTCLDGDFRLSNIQNHGGSDTRSMQWVEDGFPEDYRDCLNMDTEEDIINNMRQCCGHFQKIENLREFYFIYT